MADASVSSTVISAATGAVVAFLGTFLKGRLELRRKIDEGLRSTREPRYKELWKFTRVFQLRPRLPVTLDEAKKYHSDLAAWYFERGGWVLSAQATTAYNALQEGLSHLFADYEDVLENPQAAVQVSSENFDTIRRLGSLLRTELTVDLLSRQRPRFSIRSLRLRRRTATIARQQIDTRRLVR